MFAILTPALYILCLQIPSLVSANTPSLILYYIYYFKTILTPIGEELDQILVWQLLRSGSSKVNTVAVAVVVLDGDRGMFVGLELSCQC